MTQYLLKITVFIILIMVVVLVALIALYWAPDRTIAELKHWQLPNSEFIDIQGTQAHVTQSGICHANRRTASIDAGADTSPDTTSTSTIVLLHGTSASLHTWSGWTEALSNQYCVVSMDLPGFGLTGPYIDQSIQYSSERYAEFVIQVLDRLNIDRVILAGNSLGGKIAWRTAALYPDRIEQLILVDSVGYPAAPKHIPIGFKVAGYPAIAPILNYILPRSVVEKSVVSVYADESKVDDDLVDRYYELTLRQGNRQALTRRLKETDSDSHQEQIKQLDIPTLILWGAKDNLIPVENAALFHRDIRNSQLVVFDDLGHVPHEENPIATVDVVKQFLADEQISE